MNSAIATLCHYFVFLPLLEGVKKQDNEYTGTTLIVAGMWGY